MLITFASHQVFGTKLVNFLVGKIKKALALTANRQAQIYYEVKALILAGLKTLTKYVAHHDSMVSVHLIEK